MLHLEEGKWVFIRMDDGEDFYEVLYDVIKKEGIVSGLIFGGAGMLREFEIGWYNDQTKSYEKEKIETPHELISLNGNISLKDGEPFAHIHTALGGPDKKLVGGHLFSGIVNNTVEMALLKFENIHLEREEREGFRPIVGKIKR